MFLAVLFKKYIFIFSMLFVVEIAKIAVFAFLRKFAVFDYVIFNHLDIFLISICRLRELIRDIT